VFNVTALVLAFLAVPGAPDLYFEQTTIVYLGGEAAGPGVRTRVWHAGDRMRLEAGDTTAGPALVLRLDREQAFRLDPERRVAVPVDVAGLRERSQADAAFAAGMMGASEEGAVRTTPLTGKRTVAGHVCRGFRLKGPSVQMVLWVAEDLPVSVDAFTSFLEWSGASRSLGGLLQQIRKLPGFPLQTHSRVDLLGELRETVSTVTLIRVGPQPEALFQVPEGWTLETAEGTEERPR